MVLDASALLALVNGEPGADVVAAALAEAAIGAVNLAEVVTKLIDVGVPPEEAWSETTNLVPVVVDFNPELANATARLRPATRSAGLSLGDRACLALGEVLRQPVLTADRAWQSLSIGVEIRLIR
jgi:PIN domain nuclease of toxin-antitoxin system